jgi:signal recognition particle GTPase
MASSSQESIIIHTVKRELEPHNIDTNLSCANRATEMDITMIGLQNAGKTSLLRVLAVSYLYQPLSALLKMLKLILSGLIGRRVHR